MLHRTPGRFQYHPDRPESYAPQKMGQARGSDVPLWIKPLPLVEARLQFYLAIALGKPK